MPRNTSDATLYIGAPGWLIATSDWLNLGIAGATVVTNEARVGQRDEEASCHAASVTVNVTSMYDGADTTSLRAREGQAANVAVVTPDNFECYPCDVPAMPQAAPEDAPITSTIALAQSGRGRFGDTHTAFSLSGSGQQLESGG